MEYGHVKENRVFEYGPEKEFADYKSAKQEAEKVRNSVYTELCLKGYGKAVEEVLTREGDGYIMVEFNIRYPQNLFANT